MSRFLLLFIFILAAQTCLAQFNDSTHYYVGFLSTGSINRATEGNSYLLNNALKFNERKKSVVFNFNNSWVYGRSNNDLTNNDVSSSIDFDLYKTFKHFYYWGLANYISSVSLKINNELLAGVGAAYNVVDRKNATLNISDGVLYDAGNLYLPDNTRDIYHTYRNSFRVQFKFVIKDLFQIDGNDFIQNSVQRRSDYIFRTTTNLSLKIRKWLSFTSSLNYNRMNRTHRENTIFTYGLTMEKYF